MDDKIVDAKPIGEPSHSVPTAHQEFLQKIMDGDWKVGLYSVTLDGNQTSAIVATQDNEDGDVEIAPLFVGIYPGMKLVDPWGNELEIQSPIYLEKDQLH